MAGEFEFEDLKTLTLPLANVVKLTHILSVMEEDPSRQDIRDIREIKRQVEYIDLDFLKESLKEYISAIRYVRKTTKKLAKSESSRLEELERKEDKKSIQTFSIEERTTQDISKIGPNEPTKNSLEKLANVNLDEFQFNTSQATLNEKILTSLINTFGDNSAVSYFS